jgi:SAM-dependent methyltransferase
MKNMPSSAQDFPDINNIHLDKGIDLDVLQCGFCGTIQLKNDSVRYYKEVIRAAGISDKMKLFRQEQFFEFLERFDLFGKKIVEIGCGRGEYLSIMKSCGAEAYGLEYSHDSVEACKDSGLNVYHGFIDSVNYKICESLFDGFFMLNFLEHLPNPLETLRGINNILRKEAYGIVEVPNTELTLKTNNFLDFISDHTFYFTKNSLNTILQLSGFEVLEIQESWSDNLLSAIVKKRSSFDSSGFKETKNHIVSKLDSYIEAFRPNRVAVWGASHMTFSLLPELLNVNYIQYVIDSAKFKQNRFTPVTHIPIVVPDHIRDEPVAAIIVIAAGYSDEIVKIIRKEYGCNIAVSVLSNCDLEIYE